HRRHAAREARQQQTSGFDRNVGRFEKLVSGGTVGDCGLEQRMRGTQARKQNDVAEQEKPEAVGDDHGLRGRPAGATAGRGDGPATVPAAAPKEIAINVPRVAVSPRIGRAHTGPPAGAFASSHCWRATRRARSIRATSSAGISYSVTSRQANQTKT